VMMFHCNGSESDSAANEHAQLSVGRGGQKDLMLFLRINLLPTGKWLRVLCCV